MSSLQSLILEFEADFSKLDQQMKAAEVRAEGLAQRLERRLAMGFDATALSKFGDKINQETLRSANQSKQLIRTLERTKVDLIDTDKLKTAIKEIDKLKSIQITNKVLKSGATVQSQRYATGAPRSQPKGITEKSLQRAFKSAMGNGLSLNPMKFVGDTLNAVTRGFREQIGGTFASKLTKGYIKGLEKSLGTSLTSLTENTSDIMLTFVKETADHAVAQVGLTNAQLERKLRRLKNNLATFVLPGDEIKAQFERIAVASAGVIGSVVDGSALNNLDTAKGKIFALHNEIKALAAIPKTGLRELKEERLEVAKKLAVRRSKQIKTDPTKTDKSVLVSGGFAGLNGKSSDAFAKLLRKVTDGATIIPIANRATDVSRSFDESPIRWAVESFSKALEMSLIRGYNPDAVEMTATDIAIKRDNPNAEVSALGHSAGGTVAAEMNKLADMLGSEVKSVGLGTPEGFMTEFKSLTHKQLLTQKDFVRKMAQALKFIGFDTSPNAANQSLETQRGFHFKTEYLTNQAARPYINDALPTGVEIKDNSFTDLTNSSVVETLMGIAQSGEDFLSTLKDINPKFAAFNGNLLKGQLAKAKGSTLARAGELEEGQTPENVFALLDTIDEIDDLLGSSGAVRGADTFKTLVTKITLEVARLSKLKFNEGFIPNVKIGTEGGARGQQNSDGISLSEEVTQEIKEGLDSGFVTVVHELRHSMQDDIDKKDMLTLSQFKDVASPNVLKDIQQKAQNSVFGGANKGKKISKAEANKLLAREIDAYLFEYLYSGKIKATIDAAKNKLPEIQGAFTEMLEDVQAKTEHDAQAVIKTVGTSTNLLGADAQKKNNVIFQVRNQQGESSVEQDLGSDKFTVAGLKILADNLGIDKGEQKGLKKADLAKLIAASDTKAVVEAIHILGDDIKSQAGKSGNTKRGQQAVVGLDSKLAQVGNNRQALSNEIDDAKVLKRSEQEKSIKAVYKLLALERRELTAIRKNYKLNGEELKKLNKAKTGLANTQRKLANEAKKIGVDFTQGFALGFENSITDEAAAQMGRDSLAALRRSIDSHSPSNETRDIGQDAGKGYELGLLGSLSRVKAASKKLGFASLAELQRASKKKGGKAIYKKLKANGASEKDLKALTELTARGKDAEKVFKHLEGKATQNAKNIEAAFSNIGNLFSQKLARVPGIGALRLAFTKQTKALDKVKRQLIRDLAKAPNLTTAALNLPKAGLKALGVNRKRDLVGTQKGRNLLAVGTGLGLVAYGRQLKALVKELGKTQVAVEQTQRKLNTIGIKNNVFSKFSARANAAGRDVLGFANDYASMVTSLRGQVVNPDKMFDEFSAGLKKRGVSGEGLTRSMRAISQIAGKGVVSMEEIRQQLSESLPGASRIAADSMGMTTREFNNMVSSGKLLSSEFLPEFAKELNSISSQELPTLTDELVKFNNTVTEIKSGAAESLPLTEGMQLLNKVLGATKAVIKPLAAALSGGVAVALVNLGVVAIGAAMKVTFLKMALIALGKGTLVFGALIAAIAVFKTVLNTFGGEAKKIEKLGDAFEETYRKGKLLEGLKPPQLTGYTSTDPLTALGDKIFGNKKAAFAEISKIKSAISSEIGRVTDLAFEVKPQFTPGKVADVKTRINPALDRRNSLNTQIQNADVFGLEPEDVLRMRKEVGELNQTIDATISSVLPVDEVRQIMGRIAELKNNIKDLVANGASPNEVLMQQTELDKLENGLRGILDITNSIKNVVSQAAGFVDAFTGLEKSIGIETAAKGHERLLDIYGRLQEAGASAAVVGTAETIAATSAIQDKIDANEKLLRSQLAIHKAMTSGEQQVLEQVLGKGVASADLKDLRTAEAKFARLDKNNSPVDQGTKDQLQALIGIRELQAENVGLSKDIAKADLDTSIRVRELRNSMPSLIITALNAGNAIRDLKQSLNAKGTGILNTGLTDTRRKLVDGDIAAQREADKETLAIHTFTKSIESSAQTMRQATRGFAEKVKALNLGKVNRAGDRGNDFVTAAGLKESLGFGALGNLTKERNQIRADNSAEKTVQDRQDKDRQSKQAVGDLEMRKIDIRNQNDDNIRSKTRDNEDIDVQIANIMIEYENEPANLEVQMRQIEETNRQGQLAYIDAVQKFQLEGLEGEAPPVQFQPNLGNSLQDQFDDMQAARLQKIENLASRKVQNLQDIDRSIQRAQSQESRINTQIGQEQENNRKYAAQSRETEKAQRADKADRLDQNSNKRDGTLVQIERNIKDFKVKIDKQALDTLVEADDLLKKLDKHKPIDPFRIIQEQADDQILGTINKLENTVETYNALLDQLGVIRTEGGGTAAVGNAMLSAETNALNGTTNADDKARIKADFARLRGSENYEEMVDGIKETIKITKQKKAVLETEQPNYGKAVADVDRKKKQTELDDRKDDAQIALYDAQLGGDNLGTQEGDLRKLKLKREELSLAKAHKKALKDIDEAAKNNPLIDQLEKQKLINLEQERYAELVKQSRKEATLMHQVMKEVHSAGKTAIADALLGIGEALVSNNAAKEESSKLDKDYADKLSKLTDEYGGNAEELARHKQKLDEQRDDIQDEINKKLSTTARIFDVLKGVFAGFAKQMANVAAQIAATAAIKGIANAVGGGGGFFSSLFADGGTIGGSTGGATGLTLDNFDRAMRAEGGEAIPIIATRGEEVLSIKNNDAQFFRSIKKNGMWDDLKTNQGNFANGGSVGGRGSVVGLNTGKYRGMGSTSVVNKTVMNISTPNASSFNKSREQITREVGTKQARVAKRGLA